ncbi:MAG: hypothetical protein Ct9H300mP2_1850 [Candidatus Neomarinimicrobiota bacterium]|nr:MAG: hypothetical protein Ct9H300mP2_1850 [Candidatus Neomarinimicrobiota bacterium]
MTTHYIEEAEMLCENVAIIDEGKILKGGSPKTLTQELGKAGITVQLNHVPGDIAQYLRNFTYTQEKNRLHFVVKDPDSSIPKNLFMNYPEPTYISKIYLQTHHHSRMFS